MSLVRVVAVSLLTICPAAAAAQATPDAGSLPGWVAASDAERTVTLTLTATPGADGVSLNGARNGGVQVVVPLGWTVKWTWANADSGAAHSLVVMQEREKLPQEAGRPAFTNAMTRSPKLGLAAGRTDETTFVAEEAGWFWLLCGVPGHAIAGEYIGLKVDRAAAGVLVVRK